MKKVTAFVGSARKKNTYKAVEQFLANLEALGDVEYEIVRLNDYTLKHCRGCMLCFDKGEDRCPLKDDRDLLMQKMMDADGVVFATPNYTFGMSGVMKTLLDRFGFACHRPRYFGKTFTSIVTQGIGRGNEIVKNFDFVAKILGFNTVKGVSLTALDPRTEKEQQRIDQAVDKLSQRFHRQLMQPAYPQPSWFMLMGFRMGRSTMIQMADRESRDYQYFNEKGWLESDYYYPVCLGLLKKAVGNFFDRAAPSIRKMIA